MNKIFSLFIFVSSITIYTHTAEAQSFLKKDKIIEVGMGLGIYDTKIVQKSNLTSETSKAAAWIYPISFEYAATKRLGIGLAYKYSNFIISKDDTVNTNADIFGNDVVLKPTFHFIKKKRVNMYIGALAGISWFNFDVNDEKESFAKGNGTLIALFFGTRFYFTKRIGITINYTFNNYNFVDVALGNNLGYSDKLDLSLSRGNLNLGLAFKFK